MSLYQSHKGYLPGLGYVSLGLFLSEEIIDQLAMSFH
jgi:hypothetical protein